MTHKEARKQGLWFEKYEVYWLDKKGLSSSKQFDNERDAVTCARALPLMGMVQKDSWVSVYRTWCEDILRLQV